MDTLTSFFAELKQQIYRKLNIQRRLDERDIYRYRNQRGVNLGSWFVLEKWISAAPFQQATENASSDYDIACSPGAREVLERHWDTWMTDEDWKWLSERGINSVRLPIGYYHLYAKDRSVVRGTPFEHIGEVFEGAWPRILAAVNKAASYGMGVLIDLHAAPGKQNAYPHSGINGPVEFFQKENLSRTIRVLKLLATSLSHIPWVIGIELVNEPENNPALEGWYRKCLDSIRAAVGPDLPLYIHDAGDPSRYTALVDRRPDFVVLDYHVDRCFTTHAQTLSGDQNVLAHGNIFVGPKTPQRGYFVVAEFSAPLNPPRSFGGADEADEQDRQERVTVRADRREWGDNCAGRWMWTYKMSGCGAGYRDAAAEPPKIIPNQVGSSRRGKDRVQPPEYVVERAHRWGSALFVVGFKQGWDDAFLFFSQPNTAMGTGGSDLGFVDQWLLRRYLERSPMAQSSPVSLFGDGFREGLRAARSYRREQHHR